MTTLSGCYLNPFQHKRIEYNDYRTRCHYKCCILWFQSDTIGVQNPCCYWDRYRIVARCPDQVLPHFAHSGLTQLDEMGYIPTKIKISFGGVNRYDRYLRDKLSVLSENNILLVRELLNHETGELERKTGIPENVLKRIIEDAKKMCLC